MTGNDRPWSLPVRVELASDAVIQFEETGPAGLRFAASQLDRMFEIGLMQPPRTVPREPDVLAGVTLSGDARFLVGQVDLGVERGMEVLVRGLEAAVDAATREYRGTLEPIETNDDRDDEPMDDESIDDEPYDGEPTGAREIQIPVDQAGDRMPELLDELARGARVVLVDQGVRVAVLTTWSSYVALREKVAAASVAFWTAWRTGVFDVAGYATDIISVLHRADTAPQNPDDEDTEEGDSDEPAP